MQARDTVLSEAYIDPLQHPVNLASGSLAAARSSDDLMDPFSAIGLAGNILTFIDMGLRLVNTAEGVYSSVSGSTKENETLEAMLATSDTVLSEMQNKLSNGTLNEEEAVLKTLVQECRSASNELKSLLAGLKSKKPKSRLSSFKAVWSDWRQKDEKENLVKKLEGSRRQLDLLLASMTRFECLERLKQLVEYGESNAAEIVSLGRNVGLLRGGLDAKMLSPEAAAGIRETLALSDQATMKVRVTRILAALRFDLMGERFDDVAEAHHNTFEWIYDPAEFDPEGSQITQSALNDKSSAGNIFVDWLKHGAGIFHIAGKPGSGKSTLMKYLCRHKKTRSHLDAWADGKTLILGKFFFWNPGTTLQKSLRGLIRSLLFCILSEAPEIIPVIFPKQWAVAKEQLVVEFDSQEDYLRAFSDLIRLDEIHSKHRFVFFIDGLDEFEGEHVTLIEHFLGWCSSRPSDIKLCVSSRELPIFQHSFRKFPGFRLHELTRHDMLRLVQDKLAKNESFQELKNNSDKRMFADEVVQKSDGVFLWLKLIMRDIEDGLFNGDRLPQLKKKLERLPTELNDLFWHLLNSIHPCDKKEAFLILAMALDHPPNWPVLRLSFIEDYLEDPDFALKETLKLQEEAEIADRLERTRRKIYGKCKGLVEIVPIEYTDPDSSHRPQLGNTLQSTFKLTHRSIVEFLGDNQVKSITAVHLNGVDVFDVLCQTFLAHMRVTALPTEYYSRHHEAKYQFVTDALLEVMASPSLDFEVCGLMNRCIAAEKSADVLRFHSVLDVTSQLAAAQSSPPGLIRFIDINWLNGHMIYDELRLDLPSKLIFFAALYGMSEYVVENCEVGLVSLRQHLTLPMLTLAICQVENIEPQANQLRTMKGFVVLLEQYFEQGLSPNAPSRMPSATCWQYLVMRAADYFPSPHCFLPAVALFLFYGANPRLWLRVSPGVKTDIPGLSGLFKSSYVQGAQKATVDFVDADTYLEVDWETRVRLKQGPVEWSCREIIEAVFPQNKTVLVDAVDSILTYEQDQLTGEQLKDFQNRFAAALRPLFSPEFIDRLADIPSSFKPPRKWGLRQSLQHIGAGSDPTVEQDGQIGVFDLLVGSNVCQGIQRSNCPIQLPPAVVRYDNAFAAVVDGAVGVSHCLDSLEDNWAVPKLLQDLEMLPFSVCARIHDLDPGSSLLQSLEAVQNPGGAIQGAGSSHNIPELGKLLPGAPLVVLLQLFEMPVEGWI
ncbi:small s [Paramyrothecium foliicola]|nr:small s [Paramyrothecium foliicola]